MGRKPQSKLMSRRTERPYKVDGTGRLARHSEARCSVPEINGPVVQQEFTSLLREACNPGSVAQPPGAAVSNDRWAGKESAEAVVPRATSRTLKPDGLTTREGPNLAGRIRPSTVLSGSDDADWQSYWQRPSWQRKSAASFRKDCQEPPYADPHVRWCGSREGQLSRRPD